MTILVDADACPVLDDILEIVESVPVEIVHNRHHNINVADDKATLIEAGDRQDAADHVIYNRSEAGDIVVTNDLGLASLVLSDDLNVIQFRGYIVDEERIDQRLMMRHEASRERRRTGRSDGPSAFTDGDRQRFRANFQDLINSEASN